MFQTWRHQTHYTVSTYSQTINQCSLSLSASALPLNIYGIVWSLLNRKFNSSKLVMANGFQFIRLQSYTQHMWAFKSKGLYHFIIFVAFHLSVWCVLLPRKFLFFKVKKGKTIFDLWYHWTETVVVCRFYSCIEGISGVNHVSLTHFDSHLFAHSIVFTTSSEMIISNETSTILWNLQKSHLSSLPLMPPPLSSSSSSVCFYSFSHVYMIYVLT